MNRGIFSELFSREQAMSETLKMKKLFYPILLLAILIVEPCIAVAHQGCVNNSMGKPVCAPPMGGIMKDKHGSPVCGRGQCLANSLGNIVCSSQIGGYTSKDARGRAVCTGGCVSASASLCQSPKN
jgi:hypothetical protein